MLISVTKVKHRWKEYDPVFNITQSKLIDNDLTGPIIEEEEESEMIAKDIICDLLCDLFGDDVCRKSISIRGHTRSESVFNYETTNVHRCNSVMTRLMKETPDERSKSATYIIPPIEHDPKRQILNVKDT